MTDPSPSGARRVGDAASRPFHDGNLHVVARAAADPLEFLRVLADMTQRSLPDEALVKVRSEIAHMARLLSLGVLAASIAHEVSQPLSGIVTNASTCLRMLAADPPDIIGARETARRTVRDGERASAVIASLRVLFGKRDAAADLVDLNDSARKVLTLLHNELQANRVLLRYELAEDLPPVVGDGVQLQQVILNLLLNAVDAMKGVEGRPRQLVIRTGHEADGRVQLSVQDTGLGFEAHAVERLFEPFYTTKSDGMGIGLAVSRSIVEGHHGRLWAQANEGPGATFAFCVPGARQATAAGTGASSLATLPAATLTHAAPVQCL